jgi:hypothetical protein
MDVIEKVPKPLSSIGAKETLEAHGPKASVADLPTKCLLMYSGSAPILLETGDRCTCLK